MSAGVCDNKGCGGCVEIAILVGTGSDATSGTVRVLL
jgi:hypothetical protein